MGYDDQRLMMEKLKEEEVSKDKGIGNGDLRGKVEFFINNSVINCMFIIVIYFIFTVYYYLNFITIPISTIHYLLFHILTTIL